MDLSRFRDAYRLGAAGRAPLDPAMMIALLLYSYARGTRSSRAIERACHEDVASKVICGMRCPDHSTVAEFRRRHQVEIEQLFDDVLGLCAEAGLVSVGVIAIDGTKIKADATMDQNRDYRQIASEILAEAEETDRREDELYGVRNGQRRTSPQDVRRNPRCAQAETRTLPAVCEVIDRGHWDLQQLSYDNGGLHVRAGQSDAGEERVPAVR
jgi:transposase